MCYRPLFLTIQLIFINLLQLPVLSLHVILCCHRRLACAVLALCSCPEGGNSTCDALHVPRWQSV